MIQTLPHSTELEQNILGAMLMDHSCIAQVQELLDEEVFYKSSHRLVYSTIKKIWDKNGLVDLMNVVERMRMDGKLEEAGGAGYVAKLMSSVTSTATVEINSRLLLEYHLKREGLKIGHQLAADAADGQDPFDILAKHGEAISRLQEVGSRGAGVDISKVVMRVAEARGRQVAGELIGISSGLADFDRKTSGLCAPDLIIVAARPGAGKTAMMLNVVENVAVKQKIPVAVFSLEMSAEQLVMRMESIGTNIQGHKIRHNDLNKLEEDVLNEYDSTLASSPLIIDDTPGITIKELRAKAMVMKKRHGIQLICVDYLQLMNGGGKKGQNREGEISDISRALKALAKELKVPIIALSQLSRAVESRPDKMPQLSDLRESGAIEQDADEVILLMRPSYYHIIEPVMIEGREFPPNNLIIADFAKNRHSSTGRIPLYCDLSTMQIKTMHHEGF